MNIRLGAWSRIFAPKWPGCLKCKTPFRFATPHATHYTPSGNPGASCYALCEKCWREMSPGHRLPFYTLRMREWAKAGRPVALAEAQRIAEAVMGGR